MTNQERQAWGYFKKAAEFSAAGNQVKATWYNNAAHQLLANQEPPCIHPELGCKGSCRAEYACND